MHDDELTEERRDEELAKDAEKFQHAFEVKTRMTIHEAEELAIQRAIAKRSNKGAII